VAEHGVHEGRDGPCSRQLKEGTEADAGTGSCEEEVGASGFVDPVDVHEEGRVESVYAVMWSWVSWVFEEGECSVGDGMEVRTQKVEQSLAR
jgi:hypothetical protein